MTVVLPSPASQRRLESLVRALLDGEALARAESRTLAAIRNTLLPKLVSAQIRVPDSYKPDETIGTVVEQATAG
jgi:hypothetical protein